MPLTRRQFDLGINDGIEAAMRMVHAHLAANPDLAFTIGELADATGLESKKVVGALDRLEELGTVEGRAINDSIYFAVIAELPALR
jgi:hypothetical protein